MRAAALYSRGAGFLVLTCLALCLSLSTHFHAQQQLGTVIGEVRVQRGDFPPQRVLVSLMVRGAPMESTYTDEEGKFGFYSLPLNLYFVDINDEHYQSVHERAVLSPFSSTAFVQVTLIPKAAAKGEKPATQLSGGNPNMMDVREYAKRFPKKAFKEFQKGLQADQDGKKDDAIRHYQKALEIAPDFYPAHNNLGSDQLGRNNLPDARKEFEKVIQLNQTDAAGYFNLANVCMLMNQLPDAQQFLGEGLRRQPESGLGKFLLGSLDLRTGKLGPAEQALRQSVELSPLMAQSRLQLINVLLKEGKKAEALDQLHGFINAFPASPFRPQAEQLLRRLEASAARGGPS
jgi:predicted Zn-dependent protease